MHQNFKRSFVLEDRSRQFINEIGCMKNTVTPEGQREVGLRSDSSSYIE
jgi:hypothetical protein